MRRIRRLGAVVLSVLAAGCEVNTEPRVSRFFVVNLESRSTFAPIVFPGDTLRLLSESCLVDDTGGISSRDEFCDPTVADYAPDISWTAVGPISGVGRAAFVARETIGFPPDGTVGNAVVFASSGNEVSGAQVRLYRLRRLFVDGDSITLRVGDTVRVQLAGELTTGAVERRGRELPPVQIRTLRGPGSPFAVLRSPDLDAATAPPGRVLIRTDSTRLRGVSAGRDTLQIETTYRVYRIPVRVDP